MCFSKDAIVDVKFKNDLKVNFTIRPIIGIIVSPNFVSDLWNHYNRLNYIFRKSMSVKSYVDIIIDVANVQATPDNTYNVIFPMDKDTLEELDRRNISYSLIFPKDIDLLVDNYCCYTPFTRSDIMHDISKLISECSDCNASIIMYSDHPISEVLAPCTKWNVIH